MLNWLKELAVLIRKKKGKLITSVLSLSAIENVFTFNLIRQSGGTNKSETISAIISAIIRINLRNNYAEIIK